MMLINYLKHTIRILISQRFNSIINITGLSIGITACILVAIYIRKDLSYDKFNKLAGQIYRAGFSVTQDGATVSCAQSQALLGPTLKNVYPEIRKFSRIYFSDRSLVKAGDINNYEDRISYADSSFFEIFTFQVIAGDQDQFLKKPNTIILTESSARKYFGSENPMGKIILIANRYSFEVNGIIKDVPEASHFRFDFIAPYSSLEDQPVANYFPQWGATFGSYTYLLVEKGFDKNAFEKKCINFFKTYSDLTGDWRLQFTPLPDIHLKSGLSDEIEQNSSWSKIIIISSIALFILLLACINFVNLSTARSSKRVVEIGMRKVSGASKSQLVLQFIGESILLSMISMVISFMAFLLLLPYFSLLTGTELKFDLSKDLALILLITGGVFVVGIMAGLYPALILSKYNPINAIKGASPAGEGKKGGAFLRKSLVVFQFTISIIFIVGTLIVNLQLRFLHDYNMGFEKEYMIVIPAHEKIANNYKTIINELRNIQGVISAAAGRGAPVNINNIGTECRPDGMEKDAGSFSIEVNSVDYDYLNHFGVKLVAGRNFSEEFTKDFPNAMIINEKMVKKLGFTNVQEAIGKSFFISLNGYKPEIIGVVRDFNSGSLHNEISSQVFMTNPNWFKEIIVNVKPYDLPSTLNKIKDIWVKFFPQYPFEYHFLNDSIDEMYKSEENYSKVIAAFSFVAVLIACLGLFGLATFVTEHRKKEIGIRKVQGASVTGIIRLVSRDFLILVAIANLFAWPVSYFVFNKWLGSFAYRIDINFRSFICAGLIALLIAALSVGVQATRAAMANPVKSLE
jgi:putative ABC transport system permease protein